MADPYSLPNMTQVVADLQMKGYRLLPMVEPERRYQPAFLTVDEDNKCFQPSYNTLGPKKVSTRFHIGWFIDAKTVELRSETIEGENILIALEDFFTKNPNFDKSLIKYILTL